MTEKDEAQMDREKAAVSAMKHATAVMKSVLDRESTLARALESLAQTIESRLNDIPDLKDRYSDRTLRDTFKKAVADAKSII